MNPESFILEMEGFGEAVADSPEMVKALVQLLEVVEEQQSCIETLLAVNKKLLESR
jgi:hypothetical protein